jgi:hypothetical protein
MACFCIALAAGQAMISSIVRAQPRHRLLTGSIAHVPVQGLGGSRVITVGKSGGFAYA